MSDYTMIVRIAYELAALINAAPAGTLTPAVTAVRRYAPVIESSVMNEFIVSVVMGSREGDFESRETTENEYEIDVAVQKKMASPEDLEELDAAMLLVQQIMDWVKADNASGDSNRSLPCGAALMKFGNKPVYSPEHLKTLQVFTSVIQLTYSTNEAYR